MTERCLVSDTAEGPLEVAARQEAADILADVLSSLTCREREIVKLRHGIGDGYTYTLLEVARIFNVTRERVRQIEAKAIRKLQNPGWPPSRERLRQSLAAFAPDPSPVQHASSPRGEARDAWRRTRMLIGKKSIVAATGANELTIRKWVKRGAPIALQSWSGCILEYVAERWDLCQWLLEDARYAARYGKGCGWAVRGPAAKRAAERLLESMPTGGDHD